MNMGPICFPSMLVTNHQLVLTFQKGKDHAVPVFHMAPGVGSSYSHLSISVPFSFL